MTHEFNLRDNSRVIYIYERTCRIHNHPTAGWFPAGGIPTRPN